MKKLIIFLILASLIFPLTSGLNYKINLNYSDDSLSVSSVEIDYFLEQEISSGDLSLVMMDNEKNVLYTHYFDFNPVAIGHYIDNETGEIIGEEFEIEDAEFYFILPYFSNVTSIEVLSPNLNKITEYDLEEFYFILPKISEDDLRVSSEEVRDEEKKVIEEEKQEESSVIETLADNLWIFVVIFVVLLVVFLYSLFRRKK